MIEITIVLLCGVGFYASAFMYRKTLRAGRGQLAEPSVVESDRARVLGGIPNALFGMAYYAGVAACVPFLQVHAVGVAAWAASLAAAAASIYLAHSLLFVTRMPCAYCWTSHGVNALLPVLLIAAQRLG